MVHFKTVGLKTGEITNGKILQPAILIANRKTKTRSSGQGAWRGVDEISGMRDGGHTIPVKLLSQLGLSVSPPCSTNSSMGLSRYKRLRYRLTFWTVCTAHTGQFKAVDPQYEPKIRGTQSWFNQCHGSTGENVVGSTVVDQRLQLCDATRCAFLALINDAVLRYGDSQLNQVIL